MRKEEHTGTVEVVDEDGERHTLDEFTTFTLFRSTTGEQWVAGSRRYSLDGEHCNPEGRDAFRTFDTGRLLRRV